MISGYELTKKIDQTLLRPIVTREEMHGFLAEARVHRFFAVSVNPVWVPLAVCELAGSGVRVGAAIAFPLGATLPEAKAYETRAAVVAGAREIDVVINLSALKNHEWDLVRDDLLGVVEAAKRSPGVEPDSVTVKAIIETCYLTDAEKETAAGLAVEAGCDFVKTSTGLASGGATVADVQLIKRAVAGRARVKASGGISSLAMALALLEAGADRLGTSRGVQLLKELADRSK